MQIKKWKFGPYFRVPILGCYTWPPNTQAPAPPTTWTKPRKEGYPRNEFYNKRPLVDDCKRENSCFKCGKKGHCIADCPLTQNNNGSNNNRNLNNHPAETIKPSQVARVHHLSAEETYEASEATLGMWNINTKPAIVLFDFGVSHSFLPMILLQSIVFHFSGPQAKPRAHVWGMSPLKKLDKSERRTHSRVARFYKVWWDRHTEGGSYQETKGSVRCQWTIHIPWATRISGTRFILRGEGLSHPEFWPYKLFLDKTKIWIWIWIFWSWHLYFLPQFQNPKVLKICVFSFNAKRPKP